MMGGVYLVVATLLLLCQTVANQRTVMTVVKDDFPGLDSVAKNVRIPSRPSLQLIQAKRKQVTQLLDKLNIKTQENVGADFPAADVREVLRNLSPTTLEQLKRVLPEYQYNDVMRHLRLQVDANAEDLKNISTDVIINLKSIRMSSVKEVTHQYPIFNRDAFLAQLNLTSPEELLERLNMTNATEIVSLLKLRSLDDIKSLLPFHDVKSALKYFGVPTRDDVLDYLKIKDFKAQLEEIRKEFSPEKMKEVVRNMRQSILKELGVPNYNDVRNRLKKELSPETLLEKLGIKSRIELEKRLAQSTGRTIVQRLSIPVKEVVDSYVNEVSEDAILARLGLPTKDELLGEFQGMNSEKLLKMMGLPSEEEVTGWLKKFDPAQYVKHVYIPVAQDFDKKIKEYEAKLVESIGIPSEQELRELLKDMEDPDLIIQELGLPSREEIKNKFKEFADPDNVLKSLNLPTRPQLEKSLEKLKPKNIIKDLGLPSKDELKDALHIFSIKNIIRDANIPTVEDLKKQFKIPDYKQFIKDLNIPTISEIKKDFVEPEVKKILEDIGLPELQQIKKSVENLGNDVANEVFQQLGIPTREELSGKFKFDAKALLKKLNLPTLGELEKLVPDIDINKLLDDVVKPLKGTVDKLKNELDMHNILKKLDLPTSFDDIKKLIPILDKDKFLDALGIPDIDELKKRLGVANADEIIKKLKLKSREELKKLLPFNDIESALKKMGIPNVEDIIKQLPVNQLKAEFDKLKDLPDDIREQLKGLSDKIMEDIGVPELLELRNKLKSALDPDNLLKQFGVKSKEELEEVFKKYSPDEILKQLDIPSMDKLKNQLKEKFNADNLLKDLDLPTKEIIKQQLDKLNPDKLLAAVGLPTKDDLEGLLKDFQPDKVLKMLKLPTIEDIKNQIPKLNTETILKTLGIPGKDEIKKILDIPNADQLIQKMGLPTPESLKAEIDKYTDPNKILNELGLPNLDSIKKEIDVFKIDNVLKELGLPSKDELKDLVKIPDITEIIEKAGFPTIEDLKARFKIPSVDEILQKFEIPTIAELKEKFQVPKVSDLLEEVGLPRLDAIKETIDSVKDKLIEEVPFVKDIIDLKDTYAKEIGTAVAVVSYVKDLVDIFKNPQSLPSIGQKIGSSVGSYVGGAIGSVIAGPIGSMIGSFVGSVLGGMVGRLVGGFICSLFCARSDPPPDTTAPQLTCPSDVNIPASALKISADVSFKRATAHDDKSGDVSSTVRIDLMAAFFVPKYEGGLYRGTHVPESTSYFRFHAWDAEANHGWCDFSVRVRVIRCSEPALIEDGSYFRSSLILGSLTVYYCNTAFSMDGKALHICSTKNQITADWSGATPQCEVQKCSTPPTVRDSEVSCRNDYYAIPCTDTDCMSYTRCTYRCRHGYAMPAGSRETIVCRADGLWDDFPKCKDVQPPTLVSCPDSLNLVASDGSEGLTATWDEPRYHDNSGDPIRLKQTIGQTAGSYFTEGVHQIAYVASDLEGNLNRECSFTLTVHVPRCPALSPGAYQTDMNCTNGRNIHSACQFGCLDGFKLTGGHHAVCEVAVGQYVPSWTYHNHKFPVCKPEECKNLTAKNEDTTFSCSQWVLGSFCEASCDSGLVFNPTPPNLYACTFSVGHWLPHDRVPHCSPTANPLGVVYHVEVKESSPCALNNTADFEVFKDNITDSFLDACDACSVEGMDLACSKTKLLSNSTETEIDIFIRDKSPLPSSNQTEFFEERYNRVLKSIVGKVFPQTDEFIEEVTMNYAPTITRYLTPEFVCPEGHISSAHYGTCVACQRGTHHDKDRKICKACEQGTFQHQPGKVTCESCPKGQSTPTIGAEDGDDCIDMCGLGESSPTGVVPCVNCTQGTYQNTEGQTMCRQCPTGRTTEMEGAKQVSQCLSVDLTFRPGQLNDTGLWFTDKVIQPTQDFTIAFWLRPVGTQTKSTIIQIAAKHLVEYELSLNVDVLTISLFKSRERLISILPSKRRSWFHVAVTFVTSTKDVQLFIDGNLLATKKFSSLRKAGHIANDGVNSIKVLSGRSSADVNSLNIWKRALDNATIGNLSSRCNPGFDGDDLAWSDIIRLPHAQPFIRYNSQCDDSDQCASSPCAHGTCTDLPNDFTCECQRGYTGKRCDIDIDDCAGHSCKNDGRCVDEIGTYSCICQSGFTGQLCQLKVVNGGWGNWSEWDRCSKQCGGGKQLSQRACNNPAPANGGVMCKGKYQEVRHCNTEECPACAPIEAPKNGMFVCNKTTLEEPDELSCVAACLPGFDFSEKVHHKYTCGPSSGFMWTGQTSNREETYILPSCSFMEMPDKVEADVTIPFPDLPCDSDNEADEVNDVMQETMREKLQGVNCSNDVEGGCDFDTKVMNCERGRRRRRDAGPVMLSMHVSQPVVIPDLVFPDNATDNSSDALTSLLNQTAHNYASALTSVEQVGSKIKQDMDSGNFTVVVNGKEYKADASKATFKGVMTCPRGTAQKGSICVACSAGTYENNTFCVPCGVGTYQPDERQPSCVQCPQGLTTLDRGARELSQCTVVCNEGTYKDGNTCRQCPIGTFQPSFQTKSCVKCPTGSTTARLGATDGSLCIPECTQGTYRDVTKCVPCPMGTYQSETEQPSCLHCPDGLSTQDIGATKSSQCKATKVDKPSAFPVVAVAVSVTIIVLLIIALVVTILIIRHRRRSIDHLDNLLNKDKVFYKNELYETTGAPSEGAYNKGFEGSTLQIQRGGPESSTESDGGPVDSKREGEGERKTDTLELYAGDERLIQS